MAQPHSVTAERDERARRIAAKRRKAAAMQQLQANRQTRNVALKESVAALPVTQQDQLKPRINRITWWLGWNK
jgi:hypothetical protein